MGTANVWTPLWSEEAYLVQLRHSTYSSGVWTAGLRRLDPSSVAVSRLRAVMQRNVMTRHVMRSYYFVENGFLWEEGPNSFQPNNHILKLAKDLDMLDDIVLSDPSAPRYIYYDNKLQALPMNVPDMLTSELLSYSGKASAFAGAIGFVSPKPKNKEESIKEFVTRHLGRFECLLCILCFWSRIHMNVSLYVVLNLRFYVYTMTAHVIVGDEVFERVVDPFVSGIYAGDPELLSMKSALGKVINS